MTIFQKIIQWNKERGLLDKPFNHQKEVSFIIEELLESTGNHDSITARDKAEKIANDIVTPDYFEEEKVVDAFGDIIVFATGVIAKLGYDPDKVMEEIYKEIDSRKGKLIDGKFIKDPDATKYFADFKKCKIND
jgi:predicted HAD superfamily Cof-like phosphohydrolase